MDHRRAAQPLRLWDGLAADLQAQAQALHTDGDLTSVQ